MQCKSGFVREFEKNTQNTSNVNPVDVPVSPRVPDEFHTYCLGVNMSDVHKDEEVVGKV